MKFINRKKIVAHDITLSLSEQELRDLEAFCNVVGTGQILSILESVSSPSQNDEENNKARSDAADRLSDLFNGLAEALA